jgi:hypothetical protein
MAAGRITQPVGLRFNAHVLYFMESLFKNGLLEEATTNMKSSKTTSPVMSGAAIYTN